jgi:hypothetical protein
MPKTILDTRVVAGVERLIQRMRSRQTSPDTVCGSGKDVWEMFTPVAGDIQSVKRW